MEIQRIIKSLILEKKKDFRINLLISSPCFADEEVRQELGSDFGQVRRHWIKTPKGVSSQLWCIDSLGLKLVTMALGVVTKGCQGHKCP